MKRKVARLTAPKKFEIITEEMRAIQPDELVVEIAGTGLCHTDLPVFWGQKSDVSRKTVGGRERLFQFDNPQFPIYLGHEASGVVVEVGAKIEGFQPGDKVAGMIRESFATHAIAKTKRLTKVPDTINLKMAQLEPLECIVNIDRCSNPELGDHVAIIGYGFMGQMVLKGLPKELLRSLIVVDLDESRLQQANAAGATHLVNPRTEDAEEKIMEITGHRGCDVVIEISGNYAGLELAFKLVKVRRGKIAVASFYGSPGTVDLSFDLMAKSPIVHCAHPFYSEDHQEDLARTIWAIETGLFKIEDMITHEFSLDQIQEAFGILESNAQGYVKGIVVPS